MPSVEKTLTFESAQRLAETYGNRPENLELAEEKLSVKIVARDGWMKIEGSERPRSLKTPSWSTSGARA